MLCAQATVKGFGVVHTAEVDVFLEFSCFFYDSVDVGNLIADSYSVDVGNLIADSYAFSKSSFMTNRKGNSGNSERLYFLGLQNHC